MCVCVFFPTAFCLNAPATKVDASTQTKTSIFVMKKFAWRTYPAMNLYVVHKCMTDSHSDPGRLILQSNSLILPTSVCGERPQTLNALPQRW